MQNRILVSMTLQITHITCCTELFGKKLNGVRGPTSAARSFAWFRCFFVFQLLCLPRYA